MKRSKSKRRSRSEERAADGGYRYTGPELSALLDQVRKELGAEANIVTADRVRQGGLAGFFATETFEVVASPSSVEPRAADQIAVDEAVTIEHDITIEHPVSIAAPLAVDQAVHARRSPREQPEVVESGIVGTGSAGVSAALLERADAVSSEERKQVDERPVAAGDGRRTAATAQHSGRGTDTDRTRFGDVLENRLNTPVLDVEESKAVAAGAADPGFDDVVVEHRATDVAGSLTECWSRLVAVDGIFANGPIDASIVAVVGKLDAAVEVANRLLADDTEPYSECVVMTPPNTQTGLASERILHDHDDLRSRLSTWAVRNLKGIVVIDEAFGDQLKIELQRARNYGCTLVRLAYVDEPSARRLLGLLEYIGGHVVVDVVRPFDRGYAENLVDLGLPVVSIGGRSVDPGILFALAKGVSRA